jgi:hypothetical protein
MLTVHSFLEAGGAITTITGILVLIFVAWGQFKKSNIDVMQQTLGISKDLAAIANAARVEQKAEIENLKQAMQLQDKRLIRLEIDNARKTRQLASSRKECDMLENIIRVAVKALTRLSPEQSSKDKIQVDDLLAVLSQFRSTEATSLQEWEETQSTIHLYLGKDGAGLNGVSTAPIFEG